MKKLWMILYTGCLLLLLGGGVILLRTAPREASLSQTENRMLEAFPSLDGPSLLSGDFSAAFERYLSDRFFLRDRLVALPKTVQQRLSLLSDADEVKLAAMDEAVDQGETPEELPAAAPQIEPALATAAPSPIVTSAPAAAELAEPDGCGPSAATVVAHTPAPAAGRTPLRSFTLDKDTDQMEAVDVKLVSADGSEKKIAEYKKFRIRQSASQFNRLLALLPEDGRMYVAMVQRGEHVLQYTMALDKYTAFCSEVEDYLEPFLDERISLFRTMDILEPSIRAGEYVYFMTDHHWTIRGAYYVHKAMVEAQGLQAVPLESFKITRQRGRYLGLNYQDVARVLPKGAADYVEMAEPNIPYDFYQVKNVTDLTRYPLNDPARTGYQAILWLNMRPWKLIRTYENTGRRMLLVCDSMGMVFAPFMACYYDEVHIVRPHETYYSVEQAGGTIRDYIEHYGIDDIYVIQSNFFTGDLYRRTLDRSIGDDR